MEEEIGTQLAARELYRNNHVDPPMSHLLVGLAFVLGFVVLGYALMSRWRELALAEEADGALDPKARLREGARFVRGTVEFAQNERTAVKVEIEQHGSEKRSRNGWVHSWKELHRTTTARPFYLRRDDGTRVRVHPREDVLLVDELDQLRRVDRSTRIRTAELTEGELAVVEGVLRRDSDPEAAVVGGQGYRDEAPAGWVLSSPLGTPLHISTESLGERHRIKAAAYTSSAVFAVIMLVLAAIPTSTYFVRALFAESTLARVVRTRSFSTPGARGGRVRHYAADLVVPTQGGRTLSLVGELDVADWSTVRAGETLRYRFYDEEGFISALGGGSSIHWGALALAFACVAGGAWSVISARRRKRWYEGQFNESLTGRLPGVSEDHA